jgi:hypothetical protein
MTRRWTGLDRTGGGFSIEPALAASVPSMDFGRPVVQTPKLNFVFDLLTKSLDFARPSIS